MAQFRPVPPKLSLPPHPSLSNYSSSKTPRIYPPYSATPTNSYHAFLFSPSPTPTPSKRPRAPQGPLWILTLLHLLSFYALYQWRSSSSPPPPLGIVAFLSLLFASLSLCILYRPWKGRPVLPSQWTQLFVNAAILAVSHILRLEGLQQCGPAEAIFADFTGFLLAKVLVDHFRRSSLTVRKGYGIIAAVIGIFLLCHGWARPGCSPVAVDIAYKTQVMITSQPDDCVKFWQIFVPLLGGFLSAFQRTMLGMSSLRSIGKKRTQVISYVMGATILFPLALFQGVFLERQSLLSNVSISCVVGFGMVVAFFSEFYCEEKLLIPMHSLRAFQIMSCCICVLELLYGLGISLVGFTFCSMVLGIGIQELAGQDSQMEIGDTDEGSLMFVSDVRRPIQHIMSDQKSRKIAIFLLLNTGFMVVEFFYGFLRNSLGLISDACHMLFDCAALAIGLYASYISRLPENSKFNYGYGRFEVVSGYANAVLLVLVASLIVLESIERILEPPEISTESLLVVSVGGLLVNIVGLIFFHEEHHHAHQGTGHSCSHSHSSHGYHSNPLKAELSTIACDDCHHTGDCVYHQQANGRTLPEGTNHVHVHTRQHHKDAHQPTSGNDHSNSCSLQHHDHDKLQSPDSQDHNMDVERDRCDQPNRSLHQHHDHEKFQSSDTQPSSCTDRSNSCSLHQHHDYGKLQSCGNQNHNMDIKLNRRNHQDSLTHHHHKKQDYHQYHHDHDSKSDFNHDINQNPSQQHHHHHQQQQHHHHHHHHGEEHDHHKHERDYSSVLVLDNQHGFSQDNHQHDQSHKKTAKQNSDHVHNHQHGCDTGCDHDHAHNASNGGDIAHDHHHDKRNHHDHHHHHMDHNMYGLFLHVLADTLGSVGVVISTILIKYKGWLITDPACSIFLSALIIASVIPLLKNSAEILLQRVPRHSEYQLRKALSEVSRISGVRNLGKTHVWNFTNSEVVGSLHIQISAGTRKKAVQTQVLRIMHDAGIKDVTVELEEV